MLHPQLIKEGKFVAPSNAQSRILVHLRLFTTVCNFKNVWRSSICLTSLLFFNKFCSSLTEKVFKEVGETCKTFTKNLLLFFSVVLHWFSMKKHSEKYLFYTFECVLLCLNHSVQKASSPPFIGKPLYNHSSPFIFFVETPLPATFFNNTASVNYGIKTKNH